MKILFLIGFISWTVHILATVASFTSFNHIKPYLKDPANLPAWYKAIVWVINLSALGYWAGTILIFFSFRSFAFMIGALLSIIGLIALARYRKNNPVPEITEEEIQNFKLGYNGTLAVWWCALEVFFIGALPYLILLLFT